MATNYLAPPTYNSLLNDVPPLEPPPYAPPRPMRFGQRLENLSIGAGRGVTEQLQSAADFIRSPVQVTRETLQQLAAMVDDPRLALEMLREVRRKAASGPLGMGEVVGSFAPLRAPGGRGPTRQELDVYHGTPYRFEPEENAPLGRFRSEKIGAGEGAQAYGYGLYLAENPGVAKSYKTALQGGPLGVNVMNVVQKALGVAYDEAASSSAFIDGVRKVAGQGEDAVRNAILKTSERMAKSKWPGEQKLADRVRLFANNPRVIKAINEEAVGSLYKVDLPDKMIDRMLDWDKPLSEQPESVRKAIKAIEPLVDDTDKGSDIYALVRSGLSGTHKNAQVAASEKLKQAGIPGIRYLDAGSRYETGGTRNFVVFPGEEQNLRILERK